jgi:hypothetical protein
VNRLLHTSGLKNFADVGITSTTNVGITTSSFADTLALDFIDKKRVDTINNFDFALDIDTVDGKSKFLKLKNTKLSPYIECKTNRVLEIDDISALFKSTATTLTQFLDLSINARYATFLVQIRDPNTGNTQISDIILFKDSLNIFTAERSKIHTTPSELGGLLGQMDGSSNVSLKFTPDDPENNDYDLKILQTSFNTNLTGIGTQSIGFINLSGINTTVATATTSTIISTNINNTDAFFASIEVNDLATDETNFVDVYLTHDGSSSYIAEFYADTENASTSNFIGTFTSDITSNILSLNFENDQPNEVLVRSRVIGIGTTAAGIGTYRFKLTGQLDGTEKTTRFESNFSNVSVASTIATFLENEISTLKGFVRVSSGSTSALHQVLVAHDSTDSHSVQYPFISIGSTSGIGTFSSTLVGNDLNLNFHPDPLYTGGTNSVQVQTFTEAFYTQSDLLNVPPDLQYGTVTESLFLGQYDALNGARSDKTSFALQNDSTPIFQKQFNPADASSLDTSTGIFTIKDHFFETGERLIYVPGSTFEGISVTGITTAGGTLGSEVYAIRLTKDTFKISKSRPDALADIAVTFTGTGSGNAHEFEMFKKNEKALISIDGVIQSPMAFTPITTDLEYNITNTQTTFSVTGISSIQSNDIIKINDEFMKITNVGLGTTSVGPITQTGSVNVLIVERGAIGSASTNHSSGATTRLFSGGYNIVDSTVHFTDSPKGDANATQKTQANLDPVRSTFNGRVYLRQDYSTNTVFDDISDGFTGIAATHPLRVGGASTSGIQTGSSILLLNGIFQTPSTFNNLGNNYEFNEVGGESNVVFTGITSSNGQKIISDTDVNQNQLPRGGIIVSVGSTGGLGVAPLAGAKVKADIDGSGSIVGIVGIATTGGSFGISTASYNHLTGQLQVTTSGNHEFRKINEFIRLDGMVFNPSLSIPSNREFSITGILSSTTFTTDIGVDAQAHAYVGLGTVTEYLADLSLGSGYRHPVSVAVTDRTGSGSGAAVSVAVGAGGSLSFTVDSSGSGYTKPVIVIPDPSYENLPIVGVSRRGIGSTTDTGTGVTVDVMVGAANTTVGIGSTSFEVVNFKLNNNGYNFKLGDVFKPVGLVTDKSLSSLINDFELTVTEVFKDQYSSWNFGQFDFIDSIKDLQNGVRKRFPIFYNASLLSFEVDPDNPDSSLIDLDALLLIFVNGVIQEPNKSYTFDGGSSFEFVQAPDANDIIDIFFYKGTTGVDSVQVSAGASIAPTIKTGDVVQLYKVGVTTTQDPRTIFSILASDEVETNLYTGLGVNETTYKPFSWIKQKIDKKVNGEIISKSRDSIESQVYPTARIIDDITTTDNQLFVDNAKFFNYEEDFSSLVIGSVGGLIVGSTNPVAAGFTAVVSAAGTISSLSITSGGSGYVGSTTSISISAPHAIGVGVGTTAVATASITNGVITGTTITNPGFGYTYIAVPQVLAPLPNAVKEDIDTITTVQGFDGAITGIGVTGGIGHPTALKFTISADLTNNPNSVLTDLKVGYPIYIFGTQVGHGVTSVVSDNSTVVATGTTCVDNIYFVNAFNSGVGIITCNIMTGVNTTGIDTSGSTIGGFSWGRFSGFTRGSNPVSIGVTGLTIDSGLTTYPSIQRRDFGLRDNGSLRKDLG